MAKHLTQAQRYYICLQIANFIPKNKIAKVLGVHKSTITREINRNQRGVDDYDSDYADKKSQLTRSRASSSKAFKKLTERMKIYIKEKLVLGWSPEQISGRMRIEISKSISHESIYSYIRQDKQEGGKLFKLLAHKGRKYKYSSSTKVKIVGRIDISKRPKIVDTKTRMGDFEIDTVVSAKNTGKSCLLTMVDRRSKVVFIRKTPDKSAAQIQLALEEIYLATTMPIRTLTSDNGTEFANHQAISGNIGCSFYFARPYRSCDRGLNEHTNGLIRRYLPKGTNFDIIPEELIQQIENDLNNRPRKSLNYRTPNEVMNKYLQRISRNRTQPQKQPVAFHP